MADIGPLPYYRWYWKDWRSNRTVQRMDHIQRGLYRELLDECWAEGGIPNDMEALAEICNCDVAVLSDAWHVLSKCFDLTESGLLVNHRLDRERTEMDSERVKKQIAGRKGGLAKSAIVASAKQVLSDAKHVPYSSSKVKQEHEQEIEQIELVQPSDVPLPMDIMEPEKTKKRTRRTKKEMLEPFDRNIVDMINRLMDVWPKQRKDGDSLVSNDVQACAQVQKILESHDNVTLGNLEACAMGWLQSNPFPYAMHTFFSGDYKGNVAIWKQEYRNLLTGQSMENE